MPAFTGECLVINLRRSKTDLEQGGRQVAIPFGKHLQSCPVRALNEWLAAARIDLFVTSGPAASLRLSLPRAEPLCPPGD